MAARKKAASLLDVTAAREAPGAWSVRGTFSDGTAMRLAIVGEGAGETRPDDVLRASAEAVASALRLFHREMDIRGLGLRGRIAHASIEYGPTGNGGSAGYRAVVLRHGRRTERFATGDAAADWDAMRTRSREVAEILLRSPTCESFVDEIGGWDFDASGALVENTPVPW